MKKSLIALACMTTLGTASAQSSVTLFGVVDAGISYYQTTSTYRSNTAAPQPSLKTSQWVQSNSNLTTSRLGFRGTEDLGGGLAAGFWLEGMLNNDTGGLGSGEQIFNRRSTLSLSGAFGEIRLGRDYTPTVWNDTIFDPFGMLGSGTNVIATFLSSNTPSISGNKANYVRKSNSISYFLPANLGGFYGQAMYGFHENVSGAANDSQAGRYIGSRIGYAKGPLDVALAYGSSTFAGNHNDGTSTSLNTGNLGASYDFGVVKLFGEYSHITVKTDFQNIAAFPFSTKPSPPLDVKANGYLLGITAPVGPGQIKASYGRVQARYSDFAPHGPALPANLGRPTADKFALGYVHNLSRRTALYATFAYTKNKNGMALTPGGAVTYTNVVNSNAPGYRADKAYGYDFGIRHSF